MARQAEQDGIAVVCATPHIRHDHNVRIEEIAARVRLAAGGELDAAGIDVRVLPGGGARRRPRPTVSAMHELQAGRARRGGRMGAAGAGARTARRRLERGGPATRRTRSGRVIAHPERHAGADFEERLRALVERRVPDPVDGRVHRRGRSPGSSCCGSRGRAGAPARQRCPLLPRRAPRAAGGGIRAPGERSAARERMQWIDRARAAGDRARREPRHAACRERLERDAVQRAARRPRARRCPARGAGSWRRPRRRRRSPPARSSRPAPRLAASAPIIASPQPSRKPRVRRGRCQLPGARSPRAPAPAARHGSRSPRRAPASRSRCAAASSCEGSETGPHTNSASSQSLSFTRSGSPRSALSRRGVERSTSVRHRRRARRRRDRRRSRAAALRRASGW